MIHKTIVFVAGRSGGHLLPALTLAKEAKQNNYRILFISTGTTLDNHILEQHSFIDSKLVITLSTVPLRKPWQLPLFCIHFLKALYQTYKVFKKMNPDKVISTGGYIAIPICIVAFVLAIPIELYELNAIPGKATQLLSYLANTIYVCFKQAERFFPAKKTKIISYPLQYKQKSLNCVSRKANKVIFVLGGSQGSHFINTLMIQWAQRNKSIAHSFYFIHQTGMADYEQIKSAYGNLQLQGHIFSYEQELEHYYLMADLAIARAGAGTLFELAFFNNTSIIIPLETKKTDHQLYNAFAMRDEYPHLFTVIRQKDLIQNIKLLDTHIVTSSGHQAGQFSGRAPKANV